MTELAERTGRSPGGRAGEATQLTHELNLIDYMMLLREGHPEWVCAERLGTSRRAVDRLNKTISARAADESHPQHAECARALRCLREVRARYS